MLLEYLSSARNRNELWARTLIDRLVVNGVDTFFLSSGSRSSPLAIAAYDHPSTRAFVHFDERVSSFACLGYGRATGRPAGWITSSGTAVANGLPAVVESAMDHVPFVAITADRPPELRQSSSNQTIDQVNIFGGYTRCFVDVAAPSHQIPVSYLQSTADLACNRMRDSPGPVHLNCMFREPLAPRADSDFSASDELRELSEGVAVDPPGFQRVRRHPEPTDLERIGAAIESTKRCLIVAGRGLDPADLSAIQTLANGIGCPVFADVAVTARHSQNHPNVIHFYDWALEGQVGESLPTPDLVLQFGKTVTSKRLLAYLEGCPTIVVSGSADRVDPNVAGVRQIVSSPELFASGLARITSDQHPGLGQFLSEWRAINTVCAEALDELASVSQLSEPGVAAVVSEMIPENHSLFLASSMPVRDMDRFAIPRGAGLRVWNNRGASGIDGSIATAFGCAIGTGKPVTAVVGDLAFLYDLNALHLASVADEKVVAVVVNNNGGGIFHFLPIAEHHEYFEPLFGTPHGLSFEKACQQFGWDYHNVEDMAEFRSVYETACQEPACTVIEVATDRHENLILHQRLDRKVAEAIENVKEIT